MVTKNLEKIKEEIQKMGVPLETLHIVGVTKFQPTEKIQEAVNAGIENLAVNYAQEGEELIQQFPQAKWHFIGHIQSRKVKFLPAYGLVQSLDRIDVAHSLERLLSGMGKKQKVLVEVNIGRENRKSGVLPEQLSPFLNEIAACPHLLPVGLMAMPPLKDNLEEVRPYFKEMRRLYEAETRHYPFEFLSMGTSSDYLPAIEEGSNMVRLGTCLFGPRSS